MPEPCRPDPRDYVNPGDYTAAMDKYLAEIGVKPDQPVEDQAMDAIRSWRDNPPEDGFE
jgi:hypothetical protein